MFALGRHPLSCHEKQEIVDIHNNLRQSLALGKQRRQPTAKNMLKLVNNIIE